MSGPHGSSPPTVADRSRRRLRLVTAVALAFLVLDGVLLLLAGVLTRTVLPFLLAGIMLILALGVLVLQRRFTRRWEEIAADRQELRAEVQSWVDRPNP